MNSDQQEDEQAEEGLGGGEDKRELSRAVSQCVVCVNARPGEAKRKKINKRMQLGAVGKKKA